MKTLEQNADAMLKFYELHMCTNCQNHPGNDHCKNLVENNSHVDCKAAQELREELINKG